MVLELLGSSVDLSTAPGVDRLMASYGAKADRYGTPGAPAAAAEREAREPGHHEAPDGAGAEAVAQPAKIDNDLYMRDYSKCILCYKCVEACGVDAQNTFPRWTPQNRPYVDGANPAIEAGAQASEL